MKKQTISKIAALGLAAMTVVPMFGVTASADIEVNDGNASTNNQKQITGTAYVLEWNTIKTVKTYKITKDSTTNKVTCALDDSKYTEYFKDSDKEDTDLNGQKLHGERYYGKEKYLPSDYTALNDAVKAFNEDEAETLKEITDQIKAYNEAIDDFSTAVTEATGKVEYDEEDENKVKTAGVATFEDNAGKTVTVTVGVVNNEKKDDELTVKYSVDGGAEQTAKSVPYVPTLAKEADDALKAVTVESTSYNVVPVRQDEITMDELRALTGFGIVKLDSNYEINKTAAGVSGTDYYINTGDAGGPSKDDTIKDDKNDTTKPGDTTTKPGDTNNGDTTKPSNIGTANVSKYDSYSSAHPFYSEYTDKFYKTRADAVKDSGGNDDKKIYIWKTSSSSNVDYTYDYRTTPSATYRWYSTANPGRYYASTSDAYNAAGGYGTIRDYYESTSISYSLYYSSTYPWYSSLTRRYYRTYSDAVTASGGNSSYVSSGSATTVTTDPYTYYYNLLGTNNASSNKDTSNVTIGKSKGWTAVTKTINSAKSGSTYTVTMNGETTVPTSVMSALRGKNVNINFKLSNGVTYTINGTDIESTSAMDLYTRTGTKNVPTALKKKVVSANKGVSTSQLTISDSLNGSATLTVKFNTARAGRSAKLYRYNPASNSLSLVSTATVKSTGQTSFKNVSQSGDYIIVLS